MNGQIVVEITKRRRRSVGECLYNILTGKIRPKQAGGWGSEEDKGLSESQYYGRHHNNTNTPPQQCHARLGSRFKRGLVINARPSRITIIQLKTKYIASKHLVSTRRKYRQ